MFKDVKTLTEKTTDAGKYVIPAGAIAGLLVIAFKNPNWTAEDVTAIVAGLTVLINGGLVILVHFLRKWGIIG